MGKIENFTDLDAWKKSHQVVIEVYRLTKIFPKNELFGLTSQMQRSAVSITSNIAEGFGRKTFRDKCRFFYQSRGSISELRNQLILSYDLRYISEIEYTSLMKKIDEAHKILQGLIRKTTLLEENRSRMHLFQSPISNL